MSREFDEDAEAYRVWCEKCGFEEIIDGPRQAAINYWGSEKKAREQWSASSAAKGAADNHSMSAMEPGHTTRIEAIDEEVGGD